MTSIFTFDGMNKRIKKIQTASAIFMGLFLFVFFLLPFNWVDAFKIKEEFPRKANYFLKWEMTDAEATQLAKWDLLVLDMEVQEKSRAQLQKIRTLNPNIIILAYITPQEIRIDAGNSYSTLRRELFANISESWYLRTTQGQKISWWPGTYVFNVTNASPVVNGERLNDYIPRFITNRVLSTGLWDGVFYDNAWDSITHFVGQNVDLNTDGVMDLDANPKWQEGMKKIYNETRRLTNNKYIIMGNGTTRAYRNELNGNLMENFVPGGAWGPTLQTYAYNHDGGPGPRVNIINANTGNKGGQNNYKAMRFGLTSVLLDDGYYSFDFGDQDHSQTWYYDEYDTDLGRAVSAPIAKNGSKNFAPDVWRREFENGVAVVNSTGGRHTIELGGEYEKIQGKQDPFVNDGSIVTETSIDSNDGLILLKTFSTINDFLFTNGSFVRFLRPSGERVRNGFFAFEDAQKQGGDQIAHMDLDGNGVRDLVVIGKNKISAWRDDGATLMKVYPYNPSYAGNLRAAIGDMDGDGKMEIAVAPAAGFTGPIKIYNRDGSERKTDLYPYGAKYTGGFSLAFLPNGTKGQLIVGAGKGKEPLVQFYDANFKLVRQWLAFEKSFRGGVNVAGGNVDTDGPVEVIVGAGPGKKPVIKVFNYDGKEKYPAFQAYTSIGNPGIDVRVADVDFDGKNDIVALGEGI